jgi:hypothetical protein
LPRFSQRVGAVPTPTNIQIGSMNPDLQNSLWNAIYDRFHAGRTYWYEAAQFAARNHFKVAADGLRSDNDSSHQWLRGKVLGGQWFEVYDIVEFFAVYIDVICKPKDAYRPSYYTEQQAQFVAELNVILARELSGYRFIKGVLAPISDPVEVEAIEKAMQSPDGGVGTHIRSALSLLGRRPAPDYRNSIKESVSAVESAVNTLAGTSEGGVSKAIEVLSAKTEIHPALKAAIKQLYGYSSNEDGIRHAILEQKDIGYAEASFMLVACSALVNFLAEKARGQ